MKEHTCWSKMLSSMTYFCKRNADSKISVIDSKTLQKESKIEKQTFKDQEKQDLKIQVYKIASPIINESKNQRFLQKNLKKEQTEPISQRQENVRRPSSEIEQGETQRNLTQSEVNSQIPGQLDEYSLPTQKSDIIMNDIGKGIDQNENKFLFNQSPSLEDKFNQVYEKIKFLGKSDLYEVYLVKKKTTDETRKAYILRSYESFMEKWNLDEEEGIEKYQEVYEREKNHIKNLLILANHNCRHLLKLIDYQLHPPTITTDSNKMFTPGSVVVVFETIDSNLSELLANQSSKLSKYDKKKFIYEICACMSDIHKSKLTIRDLSLETFGLDKFGIIKANSLQIEEFDARFNNYDVKNKTKVRYLTPEELEIQDKSNPILEEKGSLKFGFSHSLHLDKNYKFAETQDLWRLGIIFAEILTGKFIFDAKTSYQQKTQINKIFSEKNQKSGTSILQKRLTSLSPKQFKTIESLLKINPKERLTCKQLLDSQYLTNILEDSDEE